MRNTHHGSVALSWTAPAQAQTQMVSAYSVSAFLAGTPLPSMLVSGPPGAAPPTSTTLKLAHGAYVFEVAAVNAAGTGAASAPTGPVRLTG